MDKHTETTKERLMMIVASVGLLGLGLAFYYLLVPHRVGEWVGLWPVALQALDVLRLLGGCCCLLMLLWLSYRLAPGRDCFYVPEVEALSKGFSPAMLVVVFIINALAEELIFRGALQNWLGLIPAALLFTAAHISYYKRPLLLLDVLATGLVLGLIYYWRGSIWLCAGIHAIYNMLVVWLIRSNRLDYSPGQ